MIDGENWTYHGLTSVRNLWEASDPDAVWIEKADMGGATIGRVPHIRKHCPTGQGMAWGKTPHDCGQLDCARSLLIDALGDDDAKCHKCRGHKRYYMLESAPVPLYPGMRPPNTTIYDCRLCDPDGYRVLPYDHFNTAVVAFWRRTWSISRTEILTWLHTHDHTLDGSH